MKSSKNKVICNPFVADRSGGNTKKSLVKRNSQLMRKREVDAMVEFARNKIVDKYYDLEN
jgi:hypothetical protein